MTCSPRIPRCSKATANPRHRRSASRRAASAARSPAIRRIPVHVRPYDGPRPRLGPPPGTRTTRPSPLTSRRVRMRRGQAPDRRASTRTKPRGRSRRGREADRSDSLGGVPALQPGPGVGVGEAERRFRVLRYDQGCVKHGVLPTALRQVPLGVAGEDPAALDLVLRYGGYQFGCSVIGMVEPCWALRSADA